MTKSSSFPLRKLDRSEGGMQKMVQFRGTYGEEYNFWIRMLGVIFTSAEYDYGATCNSSFELV